MCDFPNCNTEGTQQITRLACFPTCHRLCPEKNGNSCAICKDPLLRRITDLNDTFNRGLLETKDNSSAINETNEQSTSQAEITTTTGRNAEFYKSHEWENLISSSFEQLVIPQPSVPHTTSRETRQTTGSTSTNQKQNHCSHCGRPGHRRSRGSQITCPILLQSSSQSSQQTNNTIVSTTTISQSTHTFVITSLHTFCSSFHYQYCYFLGATRFLVTVNNRGTPWEQCMHSYFTVTGQDLPHK